MVPRTALGRAGYRPWLQSQALLASDGGRVWVKIYTVDVMGLTKQRRQAVRLHWTPRGNEDPSQ
jgi:hypothetical protein